MEAEERRVAFLNGRAKTFEKAERLARFLQQLRCTAHTDQSEHMREFLKWADGHIISLRESCSASAIDDELAESELW